MGNAFIGGIEPGGLNSEQDIRIVVCHMLDLAGMPLSRQAILDIITGNGIVNFFETNKAIDDLINDGHLELCDDSLLNITQTGMQISKDLNSLLPVTVREKVAELMLYAAARIRSEKENSVKIEKIACGYSVTCTMNDGEIPLLSFTLKVADMVQARLIRTKFIENPEMLYRGMIGMLTGNAVLSHVHSRITIELA